MLCMHFCGTVYFVFHCLFSSLFLAPDSFSLTAKIVSLVKQRACGQTSDGRISSIAFPCLCWKHTVYRGGGLAKSPQVSCQVNHGLLPVLCNHVMMIVVDASKLLPLCIQCFNWHERYYFHMSELFLLITRYWFILCFPVSATAVGLFSISVEQLVTVEIIKHNSNFNSFPNLLPCSDSAEIKRAK